VLSGSVLKAEQITSPSLAWLLPSPYFWKSDEVLVETADRNFTVEDYKEFFEQVFFVFFFFFSDDQRNVLLMNERVVKCLQRN